MTITEIFTHLTFEEHLRLARLRRDDVEIEGYRLICALSKAKDGRLGTHLTRLRECCLLMEEQPQLFQNAFETTDLLQSCARTMAITGEEQLRDEILIDVFHKTFNYSVYVHSPHYKNVELLPGPESLSNSTGVIHLERLDYNQYNILVPIGGFVVSNATGSVIQQTPTLQTPEISETLNIRRFLDGIYNSRVDMPRYFVMVVPKILPGSDLDEKLKNPTKMKTLISYTLTYKDALYDLAKRDKLIRDEYSIYYKKVYSPMGMFEQYKWLACVYMSYALHSNVIRRTNELKFEFFAPMKKKSNLAVRCITNYFNEVVEQYLVQMILFLDNNNLFCTEYCTTNCENYRQFGHFSTKDMILLEVEEPVSDDDLFETLLICDNYVAFANHRLHTLLTTRMMCAPGLSLAGPVNTIMDRTRISNNVGEVFTTYVLLLVTSPDNQQAPLMSDLSNLFYESPRKAKFHLYVGCTGENRYRKWHLDHRNFQRSRVARLIKNRLTSAFLLYSERKESFAKARQDEATYIAILKWIEHQYCLQQMEAEIVCLNKNIERMWLGGAEENVISKCEMFIKSHAKLFRFPNESYAATYVETTLGLSNFIVTENLPVNFFPLFDTESSDHESDLDSESNNESD